MAMIDEDQDDDDDRNGEDYLSSTLNPLIRVQGSECQLSCLCKGIEMKYLLLC